jgi:hypothetical protein
MADRTTQAAAVGAAWTTLASAVQDWIAAGGSPNFAMVWIVSAAMQIDDGMARSAHHSANRAITSGVGKKSFAAADVLP